MHASEQSEQSAVRAQVPWLHTYVVKNSNDSLCGQQEEIVVCDRMLLKHHQRMLDRVHTPNTQHFVMLSKGFVTTAFTAVKLWWVLWVVWWFVSVRIGNVRRRQRTSPHACQHSTTSV